MNAVARIDREDAWLELPASSSLSLELPADLSFEGWQHLGRELAAREKVLNWWIGDWWAFGEHQYGDRAKLAAQGCFGAAFQTIMNAASVCRAVETSRRREALPWSHHVEVAAIARQSPEKADAILERAEREHMTVAQVRAVVREATAANDPGEPTPAPEPRPRPSGLDVARAVMFAGSAIRMAEQLQIDRRAQGKDLTVAEARELKKARAFYEEKLLPIRTIPADFEVRVREMGRDDAMLSYRWGKVKFNQVMTLAGEPRLVKMRADMVVHLRDKERPKTADQPASPHAGYTTDAATLRLARKAQTFHQKTRPCHEIRDQPGMWAYGMATVTSEELIERAERKGFDRRAANLQIAAEEGVV